MWQNCIKKPIPTLHIKLFFFEPAYFFRQKSMVSVFCHILTSKASPFQPFLAKTFKMESILILRILKLFRTPFRTPLFPFQGCTPQNLKFMNKAADFLQSVKTIEPGWSVWLWIWGQKVWKVWKYALIINYWLLLIGHILFPSFEDFLALFQLKCH